MEILVHAVLESDEHVDGHEKAKNYFGAMALVVRERDCDDGDRDDVGDHACAAHAYGRDDGDACVRDDGHDDVDAHAYAVPDAGHAYDDAHDRVVRSDAAALVHIHSDAGRIGLVHAGDMDYSHRNSVRGLGFDDSFDSAVDYVLDDNFDAGFAAVGFDQNQTAGGFDPSHLNYSSAAFHWNYS